MFFVQERAVGPGRRRGRVSGLHLREQGNLQNKCVSTSLLVLSCLFLKTNFIPVQTTTCQCRALMFVALPLPCVFRIRIGFNSVWRPKIQKKILLLNTSNFFDKNFTYSLGLYEGPSSYRRSLQPSKENINDQTLQKITFLNFFLFLWVIFVLLDPAHQNQCGSGTETLHSYMYYCCSPSTPPPHQRHVLFVALFRSLLMWC